MAANPYVRKLRRILKGTPLAAHAQLIARVESRNRLPRGTIAGIAKAESSFGTAGSPTRGKNAWGWTNGGPPNFRSFPNWQTAIRQYGRFLGKSYGDDLRRGGAAAIERRYVGYAAPHWVTNVNSVMSQFDGGVPDTPAGSPGQNPNRNPNRRNTGSRSAALSAMPAKERMALGLSLVNSWRSGGFMAALPTIIELQKSTGRVGRGAVDAATGPRGVTPIVDRSNPQTTRDQRTVQNAIQLAKEYLGTPYVFGSAGGRTDFSNPSAFDCSGFISYLVNQVTNGRVKVTPQTGSMVHQGKKVSTKIENLKPGDAVFFGDVWNAKGHVGMYIGGGRFIHASSGAGAVTISNLREYARHSPIQAARRYIGV